MTPIRIYLVSGESIITTVEEDVDGEELLAIQAQLAGDLHWVVIGDALVFPSRVAAVELL